MRENPTALFVMQDIDKAHPNLVTSLMTAWSQGFIDDEGGEKIPLAEVIFVLTTEVAREAIGQIASIIASINTYQLTIASAVEEQTATTQEMGRNVSQAASGSGEIAANIGGVAAASASTTEALAASRSAVTQLSTMAEQLRAKVSRFTY